MAKTGSSYIDLFSPLTDTEQHCFTCPLADCADVHHPQCPLGNAVRAQYILRGKHIPFAWIIRKKYKKNTPVGAGAKDITNGGETPVLHHYSIMEA